MTQSMLDQIGGEDALRTLVEHFYDLVETVPEGRNILSLHLKNHGIAHTRTEQFDFLSGFMGGRVYYMERNRHMNLREIHAHIPIFEQDAIDWLSIMDRALDDLGHHGEHIGKLRAAFRRVALVLVNDGQVAGA